MRKLLLSIFLLALLFVGTTPAIYGHGTGRMPVVGEVQDVGGATTFLSLTDTIGAYIANGIPFTNNAGTAILSTDKLAFDGAVLSIGSAVPLDAHGIMSLQVLGTTGATSGTIFARFSNDAFQAHMEFIKSRGATIGAVAIVQDNDTLGGFHWHPDDGVDFDTNSASFICQVDDATPAVNDVGTEFVWAQMAGGGGAIRTTMRLRASGYLGLGTSAPESLFHSASTGDNLMTVEADTGNADENANPEYHLKQDGGDVHGRFGLSGGAGVKFLNALSNYAYIEATSGAGVVGVQIAVGGTPGGDDGFAAVTILDTGEVGVGKNDPQHVLDIVGALGMAEQASADGSDAGIGQYWVKTAVPCQPWFTTDVGGHLHLASLSGTETLTNKRIKPRNTETASSATPTPDVDTDDHYAVTALAVNATFGAPAGSPLQGDEIMIRIKDDGTPRTLAWNAAYRAGSIALPTTTVASETMYLGFMWNGQDGKWDLIQYVAGF